MSKIVVKYNIIGNGRDIENAALFSTRTKMPLHSMFEKEWPEDETELKMIELVDGVSRLAVYSPDIDCPYNLHVKKGSAYEWEEVAPQIISLLEQREERLLQRSVI